MSYGMHRVYFAQATNGGPIKIGATNDLTTRVRALSACVPGGMEVLVSIPGHFRREAYVREALRPWRLQGEWVKSCAPIWCVILDAIATGDLNWVPADVALSTEALQAEFARYAATPGFRFWNNGPVPGKSLFGRAQFAHDLFYRSLPDFLIEAHASLEPERIAQPEAAA